MKTQSSCSLNHIAIKKLQAIVVFADVAQHEVNPAFSLTLNAEMMSLGFIMSESLFNKVKTLNAAGVCTLHQQVLPILRQLTGADVRYQPMYPNFPQQVMDTREAELYLNAMVHYWSAGEWLPECRELLRPTALEAVKFRQIDLTTPASVRAVFTTLLAAHDSLSAEDKAIIQWFLKNIKESKLKCPEQIPFLENKCVVAACLLEQGKDITSWVAGATDILRIATYLSEGDVSLAENTRFKSLSRPVRRVLVEQLERVISEEDIGRHRQKWVKLFHNLHVGDYSMKVYKIALKARNNLKLNSYNATLEYYLSRRSIDKALPMLIARPGEFGRRLDHVLRLASEIGLEKAVVKQFLSVVERIPTRNLLQLMGHLHSCHSTMDSKVVYPKGNVQKAIIIDTPLLKLDSHLIQVLVKGLGQCLQTRFSALEPLNKVWIDPALIDCPLPAQQRSAAASLFRVARGTRLPIETVTELESSNSTLRFFIYWKGEDIDLSATFHNDAFALMAHVSYTELRSKTLGAYHSGDITHAPKGACEFIDINMDQARNQGMRYVAMNVLVYSGPSFAEHEVCYAGWMTRSRPNSNEIFDAKTVKQKIDVTAHCKNTIPVVFDLLEKKAIWVDLATSQRTEWGGNNIESNHASIEEKLKAVVTSYNKLSLYELFELHAQARGKIVDDKSDADTVFSLTEGITPFDIDEINAEFIA